jgi:hypothetical protein
LINILKIMPPIAESAIDALAFVIICVFAYLAYVYAFGIYELLGGVVAAVIVFLIGIIVAGKIRHWGE